MPFSTLRIRWIGSRYCLLTTNRTMIRVRFSDYFERYPNIVKPVYMLGGLRGKPNALNVALRLATHDIILVFDADYTPGKDILRALTMAFSDPEVGAVMGRVIPLNSGKNFLTRLLSL